MDVFAFEYFVFLLCGVKHFNAKAQNHSCEGNNIFKVFVTNECENTLQRKCVLQIRLLETVYCPKIGQLVCSDSLNLEYFENII